MRLVVQHDGREVVKAIDMLDESIAMPTAGRVRKCASASPPRRTHTHMHTHACARAHDRVCSSAHPECV